MFGHLTYLVFELAWGLPVLILQWSVGGAVLWHNRGVLLGAVLAASAYLSIADGVAIQSGIWYLHSSRLVGLNVASVPVEEMIFFVLTNAMIVQTVILLYRWELMKDRLKWSKTLLSRASHGRERYP
ncbi:MAG: lycopene cyclase domain-containing protein [Chloroflexota bacterium]